MKVVYLLILVCVVLTGCSSSATVPSSDRDVYAAFEANLIKEKAAYLAGDFAQVRPLFAQKAEQGNPVAQYVYGYMLFYAQGGDADLEMAEKWIRSSAEQGYQKGLKALALISSIKSRLKQPEKGE